MSINIGDNFSYLGKKFLDSRQSFDTIETMLSCTDVPIGFITFCKEDNKRYEYGQNGWVEYAQGEGSNVDLSGYVTDEELEAKGYLTGIPEEYVTNEELEKGLANKFDDVEVNEIESNDNQTALDFYANGEVVKTIYFSGGGGSGASGSYISTTTSGDAMVQTGTDFTFGIDFYSPNPGQGTIKVFVNDTEVMTQKIIQGISDITISSDVFVKGNNTTVVYVVDRTGNMSNSLTFYVRYGGTELTPSFDPYTAYDYGSNVRYYFIASALDTSKELTLYMNIDDLLAGTVTCSSDTRSFYTFSNTLSVGAHKCVAWVSDGEIESNKHEFNLIILDDTSLVVASDTSYLESEEGESLSIDYKVYMKNNDTFTVNIYIDDEHVSTGTCGLDFNYYKTSSLLEGLHTVKIEAVDKTSIYSDYVECLVEITPSLYTMKVPITTGSMFVASAKNKTNADSDIDKWIGVNQDGTQITANLYNFAFDSNDGWGNDLLTIDGSANVVIPVKPLVNNAKYGFTLDIAFITKPIGVENAEVLTLWDYSKDCGVKITQEEAIIKSASGQICNLYFSENELVSVIFVIDRDEKMAKIYLNGVMCEAFALTDYENNGIRYLEDFTVDDYIYLNKFGGYAQIDRLAIYEIALGSSEILNNFISLKKTKSEQQTLENFQKGDTLPTLTVYCDFSGLGKDDKKPCDIYYNSPDPLLYGESFALEGKTSLLQYQGTSSMAYPIKNYRLNLRDKDGKKWKYNPYSSGQPESRFTLKADFMSSGHWQNTGLAKWINDNLYNYNVNDEKSMNPSKWYDVQNNIPMSAHRETINGFPCRLILINDGNTPLNAGQYEPTPGNTKDMGIFNFNNDKDNTDTLGFNSDIFPYCASYEVTANSDTSAGAFISYKGDGTKEDEESYYLESFELRYPDADDVGDAWGVYDVNGDSSMGLKRLVDWVDNCTDEEFVRDFEQYFHKQYTLRYYLLVIVLGMVDNLGKNMMLDTFDHKIWMPRFYDMDTICSYDNTGQIVFDVDIEMEQGYWNTSASRLWTKIRDLMHDDLVEIYKDMRANGMSYESFMKYFYDQQISQIPQRYYNMDADVKYLPFADSYIGKAHGDGYEHLKRWLKRRLIFTDTLYDYAPSYNNDILTIRANTTEPMTLELETYTPVYQHLSWYNGQMDKKKIDGKISVTFTGTAQAATDQEVLIYGGSNIKSIKGISTTNPSQLLIGAATRLIELDASGCTLLSDINSNGGNLLPHTYLTKINLSGCTGMSGTLNMMNSRLLQHLDISGSGFSSVSFPSVSKNIRSMTFEYCTNLSSIDFKNIDTSNVTSMEGMFNYCSALTSLDVSNFNTSNVTSMASMFNGCNALTSLDVSGFDTSKVTSMAYMFNHCYPLTSLDLSNFNTTKVTDMAAMFNACNSLTSLDLSNFNTTKVTNMNYMFNECRALTSLDVSNFDTSNVTNMNSMFAGCFVLTSLNLSNFDTSNVTSMASMFNGCNALTSLDVSNFNTSNVTNMEYMFNNCFALTSLDVSGFDTSNVISMWNMFYGCNALTSLDVSNFDTSNVTNMNSMFAGCFVLTSLNLSNFDTSKVTSMGSMFTGCNALTSLDVSNFDTSNVTDMGYMFNSCYVLTSLDVSGFDTSKVTEMSYIFNNCKALTSLDLSGFDTSKVKTMPNMFNNCNSLISLDLSNFNTSKVTNMTNMLNSCYNLISLKLLNSDKTTVEKLVQLLPQTTKLSVVRGTVEIDETLVANNWEYRCIDPMRIVQYISSSSTMLPTFNSGFASSNFTKTYDDIGDGKYLITLTRTGELMPTSISFSGKTQLLDILELDTSNVTDMTNMFYGCNKLTSLDLSGFDTSNVRDMTGMFQNCNALTSLDLSGFDTSKVTSMNSMFNNCNALTSLDVSNFVTTNVTNMSYMFNGCNALTSLDVSGFVTTNVTNMSYMFAYCIALTSLDVSGFDTSNVTNMVSMFQGCKALTSLDVSNFDTSNVTNMNSMFAGCNALTSLDVINFDTSNVRDMSLMFYNCNKLTSLDLSNFVTSNVTNMNSMFDSCKVLTSLNLSNFDTSKVTNMGYMFNNCNALTSLDVSNFVTTNVTNMSYMFNGCNALTSLDVSGFDTSNVTTMNSMFQGCKALTSLDVSNFDTSNVTNMNSMFAGCNALTSLDVSNFVTSNVDNMNSMFNYCNALTSLDVSNFVTTKVTSMSYMFTYCIALTSLDVTGWPNNTYTQTAISSLPVGDDVKNDIYATVSFTVPSGWSLINNTSKTMSLRQTDLDNLTDEEIAALVDEGWTIG